MAENNVLLEVARLVWRLEISIDEFYSALGVDLENVSRSDPDRVIAELAGIFTGWQNQPE